MMITQDAKDIPVYSTHLTHGDWPLWFFLVSIGLFLALPVGLTVLRYRGILIRSPWKAITPVALLVVTSTSCFVAFSSSPAMDHRAYYLTGHGYTDQGFDVKTEDVHKAITAKYGVSSVESDDSYKAKDGTSYRDCRVTFTKEVNKHIAIEELNCVKGENLTPVAAQ